jgi:glycosyltransferase involved in cell wall biosynthesis
MDSRAQPAEAERREGADSGLPTISVVIPAHNVADVLGDQLESLCDQDYRGRWEVVVVDNRSTDETSMVARRYEELVPLRLLHAPDRASPGYARNVGVVASAGEWIVFVDGDDVADPGLLSAYAKNMNEHRIMGGRLDNERLNDPIVASWRYSFTERGLPLTLERFPFVLTSNCAIRRDVFDEIGWFDEELEYGGEDTDLSIRANLAGIEPAWVPEALVHYRHRNSLRTLVRQQINYGRGAVVIFDRYRHVAGPRNQIKASLSQAAHVLVGVPNLVRGRRRRGQWLQFASFVWGQLIESVKLRTWYVG